MRKFVGISGVISSPIGEEKILTTIHPEIFTINSPHVFFL